MTLQVVQRQGSLVGLRVWTLELKACGLSSTASFTPPLQAFGIPKVQVPWGYIGIMEKKMETTKGYRDYTGVI